MYGDLNRLTLHRFCASVKSLPPRGCSRHMTDAVRRASQRLLSVCSFGQAPVPYNVALQLQEGLAALRRTGDVPDTVLRLEVRALCIHPHGHMFDNRVSGLN